MYIKQIEIDGFKSYSQKQILTKFDTEFNAITGLNGSGKSNILDSICFVLGITDLKCIRAENMNALVYKSGQAGITKAAVTITFNNTDKSTSPYGYDTYDEIIVRRQVIVNGGTKYTINGSMVSNQKIFDFFRSVGLNVNNPHFLIMQGRITKVLNMKPIEILGMLEEAAGTKMYDQKRNQAIHFIEKKQQKVDEITNLLDTEIQPKVSRLKEEKQQFLNHQKITRDVDILKKQIDAFDYYMYLQDEKRLREDAEKLAEELEESELQIAEKRVEEQTLKQKIADMEAKKLEGSSEEKIRLEREIAVVKQTRVEAEADRDTILQQVTETQRNIDELAEENARERVTLEETDRRLRKEEASLGGEEEQGKTAEAEIKQAKQALDNLAKGQVTDEEGKATSLVEKITNARTALREAETNVKTSQMWLRSNEPKLDERRRRLDQMSKQSSSDTKEIEQQEAEIRRCEADLKKCNFDEERYEHLETRKQELRELIRNNGSRLNSILERNKHLQFVYDQHRVWAGFDEESEIIGPISSLFKVKDSRFNTALAIIASSRIYNWVFAHSQTAAAFMDKKLIQQRKTIISLDCIQDRDPRTFENRVAIARKMCEDRGEEFYTAIELLEFDPKYQKVINFIFAGICVVNNHKLASDLAFASAVRLRVVTTDGDDVKPDGSLSGGTSKNEQENILTRLEGYYDTNLRQKNYCNEQRRIDQELEHLQPLRGEFEKLRNGLERARGRFEALRESLKDSPLQMLRDEIQQLETDIPKHNEIIQKSQREVKELAETIQKYEKEGNDEKALFAKEKDKWTKKMKEAEKLLKSMKSRYENACSTLERLRKEKEKIENTIKQQDAEITEQQARKDQLAAELTTKEQKLQEALQEENRKQAEQDRFQAEQKEKDKAIKKNEKELDKLKKDLRDQEQDQQNKQRQHKKHLEDAVACKSQAAQLKKSCKTIADIEGSLGKEGDYSFKGFEKKKAAANYEKLKEQIKEMERTLNPKAHAILDSAEAQVSDLVSKIATIEKDKRTLYQTIDTLDDKKRREIMRAWEQVNQDFDHIFGTLLKGAQAKLEPPAGKTALDGLEVKVGFNNQFKDSLNELSGGQRSLVALSLVLAMLKFKPAPIYILDEVDAALDASHTANIGKMIKKYFTTSQFIIVSLKEGMFENANILFKTKFVDGTSQVTRTAGLSADEKRTMQRDAEEAQKAARTANEAKKKTAKGKENAA